MAKALSYDRECEAAIRQLERTLQLEPDFMSAHAWLGIAYVQVGRYGEAAESLHRAMALTPDYAHPSLPLAYVYARAGEREKALEGLEQAEHAEPQGAGAAELLAGVYVALANSSWRSTGSSAPSKRHPRRCSRSRFTQRIDALRSDPRFLALLQRLNFPGQTGGMVTPA
ncbi:MAG: tetratricopeptide repeat protein [Gemmatimonadales bacterium]|nr:tetratricopeptide repeat protein [Gemmatimonadales bacterium]NIN10886.1 tetratricopeptide repeat protein [Gemmatimonadales bacterium]NIR02894.1 tetratricopeptide repeat protein [Gemmatimonadales bacterium]NIS66528.1 tetratricopeptide repeat protein [Gemmatimonadales bacterium]